MREFLNRIHAVFFFFSVTLLTCVAGSSSGEIYPEIKSHFDQKCVDCHTVDPAEDIPHGGKNTGRLTKNLVDLCRDCHFLTEAAHHPVNVNAGEFSPNNLSLGNTGKITCATCHNIHGKKETEFLLRGYDDGKYVNRLDMCLDCHGENLHTLNPHRANINEELCHICHEITPSVDDVFATVKLTEQSFKKCNFCHNVKSKSHPENVELLSSLPLFLPRGKDGKINCNTCHNPHNIEGTLYFLRNDYIEFIESDRYENPHGLESHRDCEKCHAQVLAEKKQMSRNLRYRDDDIQICFSCHGAMNLCHPILIKPTEEMKPIEGMRFSREGEIICLTCHDPTPGNASGTGLRLGRFNGNINEVCSGCHPKKGMFQNPHNIQRENDSCEWCHGSIGKHTQEDATRVSFIPNPRLICLRCHPENLKNHPAGKNHFLVPAMEIPEELKLDYKGRITCTTCHRPPNSESGETTSQKKCVFSISKSQRNLCLSCHKKT